MLSGTPLMAVDLGSGTALISLADLDYQISDSADTGGVRRAITFTAHVVPSGRFAVGSSTAWLVPEPLTVKLFGVPLDTRG